MAIRFHCRCGQEVFVPDEHAGRRGKCPGCQEILLVPKWSQGVRPEGVDAVQSPALLVMPEEPDAAARKATADVAREYLWHVKQIQLRLTWIAIILAILLLTVWGTVAGDGLRVRIVQLMR